MEKEDYIKALERLVATYSDDYLCMLEILTTELEYSQEDAENIIHMARTSAKY